MSDDAIRTAALAYAERGWHVVILHGITQDGACTCHLGPACESAGKHPRTRNGLKDATASPDDIAYYLDQYPNSNIGIVCGPSELAVVDLDTPEARSILEEHVDLTTTFTNCPVVQTARGWHIYFADPKQELRPSVGTGQHKGVDLRAGESYVVAPPSTHSSGHVYTWTRE